MATSQRPRAGSDNHERARPLTELARYGLELATRDRGKSRTASAGDSATLAN